MAEFHRFVIEGGSAGHSNRITLDGVELRGVTRVSFDADARYPNELHLEFIPGTIRIEADGKLVVNGDER